LALRMHASIGAPAPGQPRLAATCGSRVRLMAYGCADQSLGEPLSMMAPAKSPRDAGDTRWLVTLAPPADSPWMVTRAGLPPKLLISACTHCRDRTWSRKPYPPTEPSLDSACDGEGWWSGRRASK